jgi:hypothetical protein
MWTATVQLQAKIASGVQSSFSKMVGMLNKTKTAASNVSMGFLKMTGAMALAHIGVDLLKGAFEGLRAEMSGASKTAWDYDKMMNRIRQSISNNQREGLNGKLASQAEKMRRVNRLQKDMMNQSVQAGVRPDLTAAAVNAMAQAGMTTKDIETLMPGLENMMVAKDIHDPEEAMEKGRAFARAIMKNQPLHLTRSDIGLATGMPEKEFKSMFQGLDVQKRTELVAKLVNLQYRDMARNMNKTEEGVARTAEVWRWMYQYDVGSKMKDLGLQWDRFLNFVLPAMKPKFEEALEWIKSWGQRVADYLTSINWAAHFNGIVTWFNQTMRPIFAMLLQDLNKVTDSAGKLWNAITGGGGTTPQARLTWIGWAEQGFEGLVLVTDLLAKWVSWCLDRYTDFWNYVKGLNWQGVIEDWNHFTNVISGAWGEITGLCNSPIVKWIEDMFNPIKRVTDAWNGLSSAVQGALKVLGIGGENGDEFTNGSWGSQGDAAHGGYSTGNMGARTGAGNRWQGAQAAAMNSGTAPSSAFDGALRAMAYGPNSQGASAADQRQIKGMHGQLLQPGDIAISPDELGSHPYGSRWDAVDANGNVVERNLRVADTSWLSAGNPTHHTYETWNGRDHGHLKLVPHKDDSQAPAGSASSGSVTHNHYYTFNHPVGQDDADYISNAVQSSIRTSMS